MSRTWLLLGLLWLAGSAIVAVLGPSLVLAAAGSVRAEQGLAAEGADQH